MEAKTILDRFLTPAREEDSEGLYQEVVGTRSANTQTEERFLSQRRQKREARKWGIPTQQLLAAFQNA